MNRRRVISLLAVSAGLTAVSPHAWLLGQLPINARPQADIKSLTYLLSPELETATIPWQIALILRNQVHRNSVQETSIPMATTVELMDSTTVYRRSLVTRERSNVCQGLAILYMLALKAHGIDSRQVQMFGSAIAWTTVWSHSSVDVWLDGVWVAMDPYFNISMRDGAGRPLSWSQALALAKAREPVVPFSDGQAIKAQLSWSAVREQYGYRLEELGDRLILGPSPRSELEVSGTWDGRIEYVGGQVYDARASANHIIFQRLAQR